MTDIFEQEEPLREAPCTAIRVALGDALVNTARSLEATEPEAEMGVYQFIAATISSLPYAEEGRHRANLTRAFSIITAVYNQINDLKPAKHTSEHEEIL